MDIIGNLILNFCWSNYDLRVFLPDEEVDAFGAAVVVFDVVAASKFLIICYCIKH